MTPSHPVSARHRLRRLAAVPALLAALLAVTLAAPAAALERMATAATVPAATGDASTMTFSVAPAGAGVVTAGQPLAVAVSARNATGSTIPAAAVRLSASVRPLTTRADVRDWLAASTADPARTELAVGTGEIPSIGPLGVGSANLTIDAATIAGLAPGVYPLRADYGADASAMTAVSVLVVSGDAGTGALGLVVPITAPPIADGLLSAAQLGDLTSSGGSLRTQLDAVVGTPAILAVDPAVVAAIRVLGISAPASATQWLADLMALPNERFALQFGDADLAAQLASGLVTPLTVTTLAPYLTASDFTGLTPSPAPTPTTAADADQAAAATPTPTPSTAPGGSVLPTLAQLTDIGPRVGTVLWPASGSVDAGTVSTLGALTVDDASPITLVDSASVASASGQATPAWASADGAPVLVYDVDASRALTTAATSDVAITRAEALAEASAFAALAVAADPTAPVLVVLDRPADVSTVGDRAAVVQGTHLAGRTASSLSALTSGSPTTVSIVGEAADTGTATRAADLSGLLAGEEQLTSFATILTDAAVITAPERASILQLLGNGWLSQPTQAAAALSAHRTQTQQTLDAVAVVPPSDITLAATSAPLTFSVRNDLPWPVSLELIATPNDPRLIVQNTTPVEAGPSQSTRVQVPVQARVGSGESSLALQLRSTSSVEIGGTVPVHVTVRAEWESVGVAVMATLIAALIVVGIVRTVRKLRRRAASTPADAPSDSTPSDDQPGDDAPSNHTPSNDAPGDTSPKEEGTHA